MDVFKEQNIYLPNNSKVITLKSNLQQNLIVFNDIVSEFEQLYIQSRNEIKKHKEDCESQKCIGSESLKQAIASKDKILQLVASVLTSFNETKNFNCLNNAMEILCGNTTIPFTPQENQVNIPIKEIDKNKSKLSPKQELNEVSIESKEESMCEIQGTPTGRTSPIIHSKRIKNVTASDMRDKKKCPDDWPTPEKKSVKLIGQTPTRGNGKWKQGRLNLVRMKQTTVVDLTCSPEYSGGCRTPLSNSECVQPLVKKESLENDDTILPSPTSAPSSFNLFNPISKNSPSKFKKPLCLKNKKENIEKEPRDKLVIVFKSPMDESVNLLNPQTNKFSRKQSLEKLQPLDDDRTHCDTNSSISLLQHVDNLEGPSERNICSPTKQPLAENINVTNVAGESVSLLQPDRTNKMADAETTIRKPEEPLYKEAAVRNKLEKRALPGWSCDECKNFYGELYKDDPVMLARKITECSKHRGRHNPARPRTPPNFWNPRWTVPEDTDDFNRMNNVD